MPTDLLTILSPQNLILFVVIFTRLSGMIATAPLISTYPIPIQIKVWFMATVTFIMLPIVIAKTSMAMPTNIPELSVILLKEFMIGYITGFIANVVFIGVEISADLISMQMGLTASVALNPLTGETSPILSQAYMVMAAMVFMGLNGFQWLFTAIFKTFMLFPPGYGIFIDGTVTHNVIYLTCQMFTIGLAIALPIFAMLGITDVLLGFVSKMMPKMNIFMVSLPVKIYLGLILFIILTPAIVSQIHVLLERYLSGIITILGG